jgi:hypothetical protein
MDRLGRQAVMPEKPVCSGFFTRQGAVYSRDNLGFFAISRDCFPGGGGRIFWEEIAEFRTS